MYVSLRSIPVANNGRLFTRLFQDGCFPEWPAPPEGMLARVVVEASPGMVVESELEHTGERRLFRTPPYRHGFVINALHGIAKCGADEFAVLASTEVWTQTETVDVANWLRQPILAVDGSVYDLATTIKIVADKEGAHIDPVVDSAGIYTGNRIIRTTPLRTISRVGLSTHAVARKTPLSGSPGPTAAQAAAGGAHCRGREGLKRQVVGPAGWFLKRLT